jgi:hypothetical protein
VTANRLIATAAAVVLFTAGCGAAAKLGTHAPHGSTNQRALVVLRELARCVRANGLPAFPDPAVGDNGVPKFPDSAPRVPASAQAACRSIAARMPADYTATAPVTASDFQKLLRLARCIRVHGVADWPDPNPLGQFPIDRRLQQNGKRLVLPALHACARLNPNPSGGLDVVQAQ